MGVSLSVANLECGNLLPLSISAFHYLVESGSRAATVHKAKSGHKLPHSKMKAVINYRTPKLLDGSQAEAQVLDVVIRQQTVEGGEDGGLLEAEFLDQGRIADDDFQRSPLQLADATVL